MIAILYWDRFLPVDDGGKIRLLSIAKMAAAHDRVRIISFTHIRDPYLKEIRQAAGNLEFVQMDLHNSFFLWLYRLSKLFFAYPLLVPGAIRRLILAETRDCHTVICDGLRPLPIFRGSGKRILLNLCDIDWLTYAFKLKQLRRILLWHWRIIGRWYFKRCLNLVDRVLVTSRREKYILLKSNRRLPAKKIVIIPNCLDADSFSQGIPALPVQPHNGRPVIVFSGTLDYFPNNDAVEIIVKKIAPSFPEAEFLLVGKNPKARKLVPANVKFTQFVPDTRPYIQGADLCICPLRFGEGTRVKILEYMALGKPVVATRKGAEGLDVTDRSDILLADNWQEFCLAMKTLIEDRVLAARIGRNGRDTLQKKYHYVKYCQKIRHILAVE